MFDDKFFNYGIVKADNGVAKVYYGLYDYQCITMAGHIVEAYWSGRSIIVKVQESPDRYYRYYDFDKYDCIML